MPAKKQPGIGRIHLRCEAWFADRVAVAAEQTGRSLSSYVRIALIAQMKRDGVSTTPPADVPAEEVVRPVGRPAIEMRWRAGPGKRDCPARQNAGTRTYTRMWRARAFLSPPCGKGFAPDARHG